MNANEKMAFLHRLGSISNIIRNGGYVKRADADKIIHILGWMEDFIALMEVEE